MKVFLGFLLAIVAGALIVYFVPALHIKAADLLSYNQCDSPLLYKIGSIDARFQLNKEDALRDTVEAINIWGTAKGKLLFRYSPKATLTVNFVYDQRQALDSQIDEMNAKLKENSQTLKQQKAVYEADVKAFESQLKTFRESVDRYNQQGGATKDVYDGLINQQKELQAQGESLNQRAKELNLSTRDYNGNVSALNQEITEFNTALAEKPEEGVYRGDDNTITLYFASNHDELIHTLAHEFGHALGMQHVKDDRAIMYPYTTDWVAVTNDDLQQLTYVCREQSAILHWLTVFDLWLIKNTQAVQQHFQKG